MSTMTPPRELDILAQRLIDDDWNAEMTVSKGRSRHWAIEIPLPHFDRVLRITWWPAVGNLQDEFIVSMRRKEFRYTLAEWVNVFKGYTPAGMIYVLNQWNMEAPDLSTSINKALGIEEN